MSILSNGCLIATSNGYIPIEDYNQEPVYSEDGLFHPIKVEKIDDIGDQQFVKLDVWSFADKFYAVSDNQIIGIKHEQCPDLGDKGPELCLPFRRCFAQCPNNHPSKHHMMNPEFLTFREVRKNGWVFGPKTKNKTVFNLAKIRKLIKENETYKHHYDEGFKFGKTYKDIPDMMPEFDVEYIIYDDPLNFMSFIGGWQDSMGSVILDQWDYRIVFKNKKVALQLQFICNFLGTPAALSPYHSNEHGDNNYLLDLCKYRKPYFHYKTWVFNNRQRWTIKRWSPSGNTMKIEEPITWYKLSKLDESTPDYVCTPFLMKLD